MVARTIGALIALCFASAALPQDRAATVTLAFDHKLGPLEIGRMALGQGGLSDEPMWDGRIPEIRALRPRVIRLFVQEYFDPLPARGKYHFATLDRSVDAITATGATPVMSIDFKPPLLFPKIDQDIVEPNDYEQWQALVSRMVRHYKERGSGIRMWEVANEPDIGEDGGCPYRFKPDSYVRYYRKTVEAVLRADPDARVGGPALASWKSPILPALLDDAAKNKTPLHFVSWHIYNSDPLRIRETIEGVKALLRDRPSLHPETMLNEWNMSLSNPVRDPRFQPCFIAETVWQMVEAGLDYSCYYHVRDYHVEQQKFARFMSPNGAAFMARWWNRMPQYDGLFDYQNTIRPSYFAFKLLSRLRGERLGLKSSHEKVHGFLTYEPNYRTYNLLLWNFSAEPVQVRLEAPAAPEKMLTRRIVLDAATASNDENHRLRPVDAPPLRNAAIELGPWAVEYWYLEPRR